MAEQEVDDEVDDPVAEADRLSRTLALFVAIGLFFGGGQLTNDVQFLMIISAFAGIGARIYIPYHVSVTRSPPDSGTLRSYSEAADYHHGAVGSALVVGPLAALAYQIYEPGSGTALIVGGGVAVVVFAVLRFALPSG